MVWTPVDDIWSAGLGQLHQMCWSCPLLSQIIHAYTCPSCANAHVLHTCVYFTYACAFVHLRLRKLDTPHVYVSTTSSLAICYSRVQRLFIVAVDE